MPREVPRRPALPGGVGALALAGLLFAGSAIGAAGAQAATYQVDSGARCSDRRGNPFCTISAAVQRAVAGDRVEVAAGTYDERVDVTRSGTSGAPISIIASPGVVLLGRTYGFDLAGVSWIHIEGFAINFARSHGIRATLASQVTLIDNEIRNVGGSGLYITGSSDMRLQRTIVEDTRQHGIYVAQSTRISIIGGHVTRSGNRETNQTRKGINFSGTSNSRIVGTRVFDNSDIGVYLVDGTTGVRVQRVIAHHNARGYERVASGIETRSDGNVVESSISYENEDSGINFRWGGTNGLAVNNITFDNGDHGIDVLESAGARIFGNTVFRNVTAGINVEGNSPYAVIKNNISVENGLAGARTEGNIRVTRTSLPSIADYNMVFSSGDNRVYLWDQTPYRTLRFVSSDYPGVEENGIQADPRWEDPKAGDFDLTDGSPAIDSADSDDSHTTKVHFDLRDNPRCDDANAANRGGGPRDYYDRGALEYVQNCPAAAAQN